MRRKKLIKTDDKRYFCCQQFVSHWFVSCEKLKMRFLVDFNNFNSLKNKLRWLMRSYKKPTKTTFFHYNKSIINKILLVSCVFNRPVNRARTSAVYCPVLSKIFHPRNALKASVFFTLLSWCPNINQETKFKKYINQLLFNGLNYRN